MYHVTLGGQGFLVDPATYVVRALPQVGGTSIGPAAQPSTADPGYERVQRLAHFGRGEGVERFAASPAPAAGWRAGHGVLPTPGGALRLGPALLDAGGGPAFGTGARAFAAFRGRLYAGLDGSPGEVWSFDGAAWSLAFSLGKPGVRSLAVYRDALYAGNAGDGAVQRWDGATLSTAWTNAGVAAIEALAVAWFDGLPRLYVGNSVASGLGWVQAYDGAAQSLVATLEEPRVEALVVHEGRLFVAAAAPAGQPRGALYSYAGTPASFTRERAFADGYPAALLPLDQRLVLGWSAGGRLLTWEPGARRPGELPLPLPDGGPARALATTADGALWAAFRDPVAGDVRLRRLDPHSGGWSVAVTGGVGDAALALTVAGGSLYLGVARAAGGARIYRADVGAVLASSGQVETPPFDLDLPDLEKAPRAVDLRHAPLPAGASIGVDYRVEPGGAWTLLGAAATAGSEASSLPFPAATPAARALALRARLVRGAGATDGPELREVALRAVLAPALRREWSFAVLLEGDTQRPLRRLDGSAEPLAARQIAAALWALRAQPGPLAFIDLEGAARTAWLREVREVPQKAAALTPSAPWTVAHLTLVEA